MNNVEERLASVAKQTLEELKKEGAADDNLEFSAVTYDNLTLEKSDAEPLWDCFISFKKASSDESFLQVRFRMRPSTDMDGIVRQEIRNQLKEQNWVNG
ncbi:MAG TPA: hypothetical protein VGP08_07095 [Pyrinomonadaceae bacterium]|jgi:hypothetical protein|nr:hypothetical protein [Pyrinomonadaceae bacterium]